jgi:hypothetical protein
MVVVEKLNNKLLYKVLLLLLKYIPMIISLFYLINTITAYIGVDLPILSNIAGMSLLTWIFMYIAAIVFKFCIYHRMFLYYILVTDIINIIDYYYNIPVNDFNILMIHSSVTCICLFLILYFYVKSYKKRVTKNNR